MNRTNACTVQQRECIGDVVQQSRNLNPIYHPMQRAREYTRAVNAVKMDRMFAKPLISGNFENGHRDSIISSSINRRSLLSFISGSVDGCIKLWDIPTRKEVIQLENAHSRGVTGLTFSTNGQYFYSCSDDGYIHQWSIHPIQQQQQQQIEQQQIEQEQRHEDKKRPFMRGKPKSLTTSAASALAASSSLHGPMNSWRSSGGSFKAIDHHWFDNDIFASSSDDSTIQIWSCNHTKPIMTFANVWGSHDTINKVKYNPSERNIIAHCSVDRGIGIHDTRTSVSLKKSILKMNSNDICWNPMEPMIFVVGNEDYNSYTFDMRYLNSPLCIYKGHTGAVLSVSYSPTGQEFVSGSYDKTLRIYNSKDGGGNCRDIYHTKRMQRIMTTQYTMDNKFIISCSDDTNIRLWKTISNDILHQTTLREEHAIQYRKALITKYQHLPEIRRIYKSRKIPKAIKNQTKQNIIVKESIEKKHANRVKHDKTGKEKFTSQRNKTVIKEIE